MASKKPLSDGERKNITTICKNHVCFQGVIKYTRQGGVKMETRLLALSRYRFFFLKRGSNGKVLREHHLYELEAIEGDEMQVNAKFKPESLKDPPTVIQITPVGDSTLLVLIQAIHSCLRPITIGFPEEFRCQSHVQIDSTKLAGLDDKIRAAGGLIEAYKAQSDFFKVLYSTEVIHVVEDMIYTQSTELNLNLCPGIEPNTELSFSLQPLFAALRHNTYITSIVMEHNSRKELMSLTADVLRYNTNIKRLSYKQDISSGCSNVQELGDAIRDNKHCALEVLEFTCSNIGDKGVTAIANGIRDLGHGLVVLNLAYCGLTEKGILQLISAFEKNFMMSLAIEELDLSGNRFDDSSSHALSGWLMAMKENSKLRILKMSNTNVNLASVARGMNFLSKITHFDISCMKIESNAVQVVASALEMSASLRYLDISNSNLSGEAANQIITAFSTNKKIDNTTLKISKNAFSSSAELIAIALDRNTNLHTLDLSEHSFSVEAFLRILLALNGKKLNTLILDNAFKKSSKSTACDKVASGLSSLVWLNSHLQKLSICGTCYTDFFIPFLQGISKNPSLTALRMSDTKATDLGASAVAGFLRINTTLTSLALGNNQFSVAGWLCISSALQVNYSLLDLGGVFFDSSQSESTTSFVPEPNYSDITANAFRQKQLNYAYEQILNCLRRNQLQRDNPQKALASNSSRVPKIRYDSISDFHGIGGLGGISGSSHFENGTFTQARSPRNNEKTAEAASEDDDFLNGFEAQLSVQPNVKSHPPSPLQRRVSEEFTQTQTQTHDEFLD